MRAEVEIEQASRNYLASKERIASEVRAARLRYDQAQRSIEQWRTGILPPLEQTTQRAQRAFEAGDVPLLFVLETTARFIQAQFQLLELNWNLRRSRAELERSIGRRLDLS